MAGIYLIDSNTPGFFTNYPECKTLDKTFGMNNYIGLFFGGNYDIMLSPKQILEVILKEVLKDQAMSTQITEIKNPYTFGTMTRFDLVALEKINQMSKNKALDLNFLVELLLTNLKSLNLLWETDTKYIFKYVVDQSQEVFVYEKDDIGTRVTITYHNKRIPIYNKKSENRV